MEVDKSFDEAFEERYSDVDVELLNDNLWTPADIDTGEYVSHDNFHRNNLHTRVSSDALPLSGRASTPDGFVDSLLESAPDGFVDSLLESAQDDFVESPLVEGPCMNMHDSGHVPSCSKDAWTEHPAEYPPLSNWHEKENPYDQENASALLQELPLSESSKTLHRRPLSESTNTLNRRPLSESTNTLQRRPLSESSKTLHRRPLSNRDNASASFQELPLSNRDNASASFQELPLSDRDNASASFQELPLSDQAASSDTSVSQPLSGEHTDVDGRKFLLWCIAENNRDGLMRYLWLVRDGMRPSHNDVAVHYAVYMNRCFILLDLLSFGYHHSLPDHAGSTPLHYACNNGFYGCVNILICFSADLEAIDVNGRTPIFEVSPTMRNSRTWNSFYWGNGSPSEIDLVLSLKTLLHMGARLHTEDNWYCTACSVANLHTLAGRLLVSVSLLGLGAVLDRDMDPCMLNAETLADYYNGIC